MALISEWMEQCGKKVLDNASIVRRHDFTSTNEQAPVAEFANDTSSGHVSKPVVVSKVRQPLIP
jgi:hypothetical protein